MRNKLPSALILLLIVLSTSATFALSAGRKLLKIIDSQFYYPQYETKKGFTMRIVYTGAEEFLKAKLRKGEKSGKIYVSWDKKTSKLSYNVKSIAPRLSAAVEAILKEYQDSILPRTISSSLNGYILQVKQEGKNKKLIAFIPKERFLKGKVPHVVRVEYVIGPKNQVTETHAYLHSGDQVDAKWTLKKNKYKKYMIQSNVLTLKIRKGILTQNISYTYAKSKGLILPKTITIKSSFNGGKSKTEYIKFSEYKIH